MFLELEDVFDSMMVGKVRKFILVFVINCFLCIEYFYLFYIENEFLFACYKILLDLKENFSREYF